MVEKSGSVKRRESAEKVHQIQDVSFLKMIPRPVPQQYIYDGVPVSVRNRNHAQLAVLEPREDPLLPLHVQEGVHPAAVERRAGRDARTLRRDAPLGELRLKFPVNLRRSSTVLGLPKLLDDVISELDGIEAVACGHP